MELWLGPPKNVMECSFAETNKKANYFRRCLLLYCHSIVLSQAITCQKFSNDGLVASQT